MQGDNVIREKWPKIRQYMDKGKPLYQVDARRKGTTGKRESFVDLQKAKDRAEELAKSIVMEGIEGMAIRPELRLMALNAERLLAAHGKNINDALEFYLAHLEAKQQMEKTHTVKFLAAEWEKDKTKNPLKPLRGTTVRDIKHTAADLTRLWGTKRIAEITKEDIETHLKGLEVGNRRKDNLRNRFGQFFNWTIAKKHHSENPLAEIEIVVEQTEVVILAIDAAKAMFAQLEAEPEFYDLIPYFAVCCFGGLRPTEAELLTWEMISLEHRTITVLSSTSKVKDSRNVDIEDTLYHWLKNWTGEKKGRIINPVNLQKRLIKFRASLGYKYTDPITKEPINPDGKYWVPDIMRHSYASYSLALKKDYGHVALQMGNSIEVIKASYKILVAKIVAQEFWKILPAKVAKAVDQIFQRTKKKLANS